MKLCRLELAAALLGAAASLTLVGPVLAATHLTGQVEVGSGAVAHSQVTLWEASAAAPKMLAQVETGADGRFAIDSEQSIGDGAIVYLVAAGGEPALGKAGGDTKGLALLAVLGAKPPTAVTVNELTTVASAFTAAQFINGESISGNPLGLKIAAGNAPNLVDPATGGLGKVILDPINITQTTALANLDTLASLVAAFATVADDNWRARFLKAATPTGGATPTNTLEALAGIAREPWAAPKELFALFDEAYPQPKDGSRAAPFLPYLTYVPDDFALSLAFAGGGMFANGKFVFDAQGNLWSGQNWMPGSQPASSTASVAASSSSPPTGHHSRRRLPVSAAWV